MNIRIAILATSLLAGSVSAGVLHGQYALYACQGAARAEAGQALYFEKQYAVAGAGSGYRLWLNAETASSEVGQPVRIACEARFSGTVTSLSLSPGRWRY